MKTLLLFLSSLHVLCAKESPVVIETKSDISYYSEAALEGGSDYQKSQCKLDIRYPAGKAGFSTLVWFHGGGLTSGERNFLDIEDKGIAVVAVSYRLSPEGRLPEFFEDAAAATAWTLKHVADYGGDPKKVFVGGHSAGGYLALMIGMDSKWLAKYEISNMDLAALVPVSSQVTTHFHVKELLGNKSNSLVPSIDTYAPLHFVSKNLPPICIITGDRKMEFPSRVEENDFFAVTLKNLKHPSVEFHEILGADHGSAAKKSAPLVADYINRSGKR
jgi:acetyl esterase/lipase